VRLGQSLDAVGGKVSFSLHRANAVSAATRHKPSGLDRGEGTPLLARRLALQMNSFTSCGMSSPNRQCCRTWKA
jgi:hypothetical protein